MATTLVKIASVTVDSGGSSSIDFQNIPATYTDLIVLLSIRSGSSSGGLYLQFNNDTGSNYSWRRLVGSGSAVSSSSSSATTEIVIGRINASTYTASVFASNSIYIPNYTSSNYKSVSGDSVEENNATAASQDLNAGLWSSSAVINRVTFTAPGNFAQYSTAVLYGIKSS